MFKPSHFPGQKPEETVNLFLRRHWLTFLPIIIAMLFLILVPLFLFLGIKSINLNLQEFRDLIILAASSYLLIILSFFLVSFIDFYLDVYIITNQRILDIDQNGLFNRSISGQNLSRVQDVSSKKKGILQTFFDYGDVFIQTAAELPNFEFNAVAKPDKVAEEILKLSRRRGQKPPGEAGGSPPQPETKEISQDELKKGGEINL